MVGATRRVKAFFDEVAEDWDEMRSTFYNEGVIDALAEHVAVTADARIVDVGTGTGFVAAGLASRASSIVGIDHAAGMLHVARRNLDALTIGNVRLVAGGVDQLPLPDASVDGAVANMVLHHAENPSLMLREMRRVVRPGGWVAITDEMEHPYEWMRTEQADIWLGFTPQAVAEFFTDAQLQRYGYASLGMQ
jgi:ArsR family transcriptional regulator